MSLMDKYYDSAIKASLYTKPSRLKFYLEDYLFKGIDFKNKNVLDIGGGSGLFSFYAACNGANHVVVMEPEIEGSTRGISEKFNEFNTLLGNLNNIEFNKDTLQSYNANFLFDIILMHNSINHLNEDACMSLENDKDAQNEYRQIFKKLNSLSTKNGLLLITDCSRYNFYPGIGIKNPLAPYIEWEKHQSPETWAKLLKESGYDLLQTKWFSPNAFGKIGRLLMGNKIVSYFLASNFKILLKNTK